MTKKVLIVCTSHDKLGNRDEATGLWLEELAAPYLTFKEAGLDVVVASVLGGKIPLDANSLASSAITPECAKFQHNATYMELLENSPSLAEYATADVDAIFLPGGHGTCYDLPENQTLIHLLQKLYSEGKIVSAVCHGPVGLVNVKDAHGHPIVKGKKVTGFSDSEEHAVGKQDAVPFLLETKLKELGGIYSAGPDWHVHVVQDGNLITGQNPGSSGALAKAVVEALQASQAAH